jgi:hypothetical protein
MPGTTLSSGSAKQRDKGNPRIVQLADRQVHSGLREGRLCSSEVGRSWLLGRRERKPEG